VEDLMKLPTSGVKFGVACLVAALALQGCGGNQQKTATQPAQSLVDRENAIQNDPKIPADQKAARISIERAKERDAMAMAAKAKGSKP
jgi:hypothetical protein